MGLLSLSNEAVTTFSDASQTQLSQSKMCESLSGESKVINRGTGGRKRRLNTGYM